MYLRDIHQLTGDTREVVAWCRRHGLLAREKDCDTCGADMNEGADPKRNNGLRWRCRNRECRREASVRVGSFFAGSKLEIAKIVDLMYVYSYEMASVKNLVRQCRIVREAIVNWRNFIRDIYAEYFVRHPLRIGGPGHVVEIDESTFVRRKHM